MYLLSFKKKKKNQPKSVNRSYIVSMKSIEHSESIFSPLRDIHPQTVTSSSLILLYIVITQLYSIIFNMYFWVGKCLPRGEHILMNITDLFPQLLGAPDSAGL